MRSLASLRHSKDLWAGLLFVSFGAAFVYLASGLRMGTANRMGPAYFPTILGAILAGLGLVIGTRGVAASAPRVALGRLRPVVVVLASVLVFGLMLQPLGVALATVVLVALSRLGAEGLERPREVAVLAAALALFAALLFVRGLALPLKIWP